MSNEEFTITKSTGFKFEQSCSSNNGSSTWCQGAQSNISGYDSVYGKIVIEKLK